MRNGTTLLGTLTQRTQVIGAGGWNTGCQVSSDGTFLNRTDTFGAYSLAPGATAWVQELIPGTTVAASDIDLLYTPDGSAPDPSGQYGTYGAAIAWSNSAIRYLACMGYVFVKKPSASNYTRTALPQKSLLAPNEPTRMYGNALDVDPANPGVVWFAAPQGVFYSTDYGDTWTTVSTATLPAPSTGKRSSVRFDRHSSVVGTGSSARTQRILIYIPGSGLYESTNAGSTWGAITARPSNTTVAAHMKVDPANGNVFLSGSQTADNGQVSRWTGSWNEPSTATDIKTIVISPHNAGHIYGLSIAGGMRVSTDGGVNFSTDIADQSVGAVDVGWHTQAEHYKSLGEAEFSPLVNTIFVAGGIGAWKIVTPPTSVTFASTPAWTGFSKGIENMVMATASIAPDGTRGFTMHDRGCMIVPAGNAGLVFPSKYGPKTTQLDHAQMCDWAPEDNAFWIAAHTYETDLHVAYTPDRGTTWTEVKNLVTQTSGRGGGQVVCLSKDVWLAIQISNFPYGSSTKTANAIYLTTNGRAGSPTWTEVQIGNGNAVMSSLSRNTSRRTLLKDRFTTGNLRRVIFYTPSDVDNPASTDTLSCRGLWEIIVNMTTGATTVTRKYNGTFMPSNMDSYYGHLTQVSATDWLWSGGDNAVYGLYRIHDNGTNSWDVSTVTGTDDQSAGTQFAEVAAAAVGKAYALSSYPTLYVLGYRQNSSIPRTNDHTKYGLWRSVDDGATWQRIMQFPGGNFDWPMDMIGDPNNFGKLDILFGGTGTIHVDYVYTLRAS